MPRRSRISLERFEALATLARLPHSAIRDAAMLVMVRGMKTAEAAELTGADEDLIHNPVKRCRAALELARIAVRRTRQTLSATDR